MDELSSITTLSSKPYPSSTGIDSQTCEYSSITTSIWCLGGFTFPQKKVYYITGINFIEIIDNTSYSSNSTNFRILEFIFYPKKNLKLFVFYITSLLTIT